MNEHVGGVDQTDLQVLVDKYDYLSDDLKSNLTVLGLTIFHRMFINIIVEATPGHFFFC